MSMTWFNTTKCNSGFTLIEVLVTIIIVSIGLLGLAGLQIGGLRANMSSEARSKATLLANDIVERMRANLPGVEAGAYNIDSTETICAGDPPVPFCSSTTGSDDVPPSCTETEMATFDVWTWGCDTSGVNNQLRNGTATIICRDNNPGDGLDCSQGSQHTVTINWREFTPFDTGTTDAGENTPQFVSLRIIP